MRWQCTLLLRKFYFAYILLPMAQVYISACMSQVLWSDAPALLHDDYSYDLYHETMHNQEHVNHAFMKFLSRVSIPYKV